MLATRTHGGLLRHPFFRFDPAFNALFREVAQGTAPVQGRGFADEGDHYALYFNTPGLSREDIVLTLEDGVLSVVAERKLEVPDGYEAIRRERRNWRLERRLQVPRDADVDTVAAALEDGVLKLTVSKGETPTARTIEIA